jgi:hypothetical protein
MKKVMEMQRALKYEKSYELDAHMSCIFEVARDLLGQEMQFNHNIICWHVEVVEKHLCTPLCGSADWREKLKRQRRSRADKIQQVDGRKGSRRREKEKKNRSRYVYCGTAH